MEPRVRSPPKWRRVRVVRPTGAWASAAEALISAVSLTRDAANRERYLLDAIEWMLVSGQTTEAGALAGTLGPPEASARQQHVRGHLALVTGSLATAEVLLTAAWGQCDSQIEPDLASRIASQLAWLHHTRWNGTLAATWALRALEVEPTEARAAARATDILLLALGASGRFGEAQAYLASLPQGLHEGERCRLDGMVGRSVVTLWGGDTQKARDDLTATLDAYRRHGGPAHLLVVALTALADAEYRLGDWDRSLVHGGQAVATAEDAEQHWLLGPAHAVTAFAHVGRGQWREAETQVASAKASARAVGGAASTAYAATSQALLAATRHDPVGVITALEPVLKLRPCDGIDNPGVLPWCDLYVEALTALARYDEAALLLARYEAMVRKRRDPASTAVVRRLRGNLESARGDSAQAESAYSAALEEITRVPLVLERARIGLRTALSCAARNTGLAQLRCSNPLVRGVKEAERSTVSRHSARVSCTRVVQRERRVFTVLTLI